MLPPLTITVTGHSTISLPAERATLTLTVSSTSPSQATVSKNVQETSNKLRTLFTHLAPKDSTTGAASPTAAITIFSMTSLETYSRARTDRDRDDLPPTFTASTSFEVIFRDFVKLGQVTGELLAMEHVQLDSTEWKLTDETFAKLKQDVRKHALRDAMSQADDFADVVGRKVFAAWVSHGVVRQGGRTKQTARVTGGRAFNLNVGTKGSGLELEAQDVSVSADVEVRFESERGEEERGRLVEGMRFEVVSVPE